MEIEELKTKLREMSVGYKNTYSYPKPLTPEQVDETLDELGSTEGISENWNGCDLDWGQSIKFEGHNFEVWGSGYSGSMVFQKIS